MRPIISMTDKSAKCLSDTSDQKIDTKSSENDLTSEIFSYLYVSRRFANKVYNVLRPNFGSNYLQKIDHNLNFIKRNLINRGIDLHFDSKQMSDHLKKLIEFNQQLEPKLVLKEKIMNKINAKRRQNKTVSEDLKITCEQVVNEVRLLSDKVWDLERVVIKFILDLPNHCHDDHVKLVEEQSHDRVVDRYQPKQRTQSFKRLNHNLLSYINKCLYQSIVGPKSYYLTSIGTQLNDSLIDFFAHNLRRNQFIDVSGVDFVKTALIEATHYNNLDNFKLDPLAISAKANESASEKLNQSLHLVGNSSLESICALISKREFTWNSETIKLLSIGQQFEQNLTQNNVINATIITKEDNELSDHQMDSLYALLWNSLTELELMSRSVILDAKSLNKSEFSRIDLQVWLNSENQWITALQISDYREYLSIRLGAPDCHIINAKINVLPIILSIIEQKQTVEANIEIPQCLKQF